MSRVAVDLAVLKVTPSHLANTATDPDAVIGALWQQLSADTSQPPSHKRQKLEQPAPGEESICIASIAIGLTTGDAPLDEYLDAVDPPEAEPAAIVYYSVDRHSNTGSLMLASPNATPKSTRTILVPSIIIQCTDSSGGDDKDSAGFHLANISRLHRSRDGSSSSWPLWVHTSLVRNRSRSKDAFLITSRFYWKTHTTASRANRPTCDEMLATYLLPREELPMNARTPQAFYNSVHVPDKRTSVPDAVQHPDLDAELYPFQRRAVSWLLGREGVQLQEDGSVKPVPVGRPIPLSFRRCEDATGQTCYASSLFGRVVRAPEDAKSLHSCLSGGILAEEMGLGKTVEMISLMALNPRKEGVGTTFFDPYSDADVTASGATLIITPPVILEQWITEIDRHFPTLKVFQYKTSHRNDPSIKQILLEHDVVVTTYAVLSKEIHHANERPQRAMRHEKKYEAPKSPLVEILWWRVCLDEAQMIESGVSNAAIVARRIPRCNAWAITGTPVRKDIQDLCGLLIFLRYEPFCHSEVWSTMTSSHVNVFESIFGQIALRHSKAQVSQDLRLPPQKRITVTIPFTAIEEQHYGEMFQQMCDEVGVDVEGAPLYGNWDPEDPTTVDRMRTWLTRLRQTCLHPEVGDRNRRALGQRTGPLRTVEAVLDVMIEQNEAALRSEERASLSAKVTQGHLFSFAKEGEKALEIYQETLASASVAVDECRKQLTAQEAIKASAERKHSPEDAGPDADGDEDKSNASHARTRLRNALELQHVCVFFAATAYYQLKTDTSNIQEGSDGFKELELKESEYYERAKLIRKEILAEATRKSRALMTKVHDRKAILKEVLKIDHTSDIGGIQSRRIMVDFSNLKQSLNAQATKISEWRDTLSKLLTVNLLDQEEDVEMTGDEYEETLKQQDESYAYLFLMRALIADRHEMLTGQENFLLQHEIKEALKVAEGGQGHAPELTAEGLKLRSKFIPSSDVPLSLRGVVAELRAASASLTEHHSAGSAVELELLERELWVVQKILSEQIKEVNALTKDLELFRNTMNQRLEYYRQLQEISDRVQPYAEENEQDEEEGEEEEEEAVLNLTKLDEAMQKETLHSNKLATLRTKSRFLQHLKSTKDKQDERRPCIICQSPFEIGILTVCAHEFCKDCIQMWISQHKSCPMCKRALHKKDLHGITYKPQQLRAEEEQKDASSGWDDGTSPPKGAGIYTSIKQQTLDEIRAIDLPRSWGSKVDSIARHLLHLRGADAGNKAIIFSQYRDFLQVLEGALRACQIGFSGIADKDGIRRFKEDASAECFLLHAKAESSGLNLVNATHVFLCEPLINTAIELQAIARVHRIGQRRTTTVWMYLVRDTIEEAIYDISVARRLEHVNAKHITTKMRSATQSKRGTPAPDEAESKLDAANSLELEKVPLSKLLTKGQSGGEMVQKDDLWSCLFARTGRNKAAVASMGELEGMMGRELRADAAEKREQQR